MIGAGASSPGGGGAMPVMFSDGTTAANPNDLHIVRDSVSVLNGVGVITTVTLSGGAEYSSSGAYRVMVVFRGQNIGAGETLVVSNLMVNLVSGSQFQIQADVNDSTGTAIAEYICMPAFV